MNSFLVWDASLLVTVSSRQFLYMTVGKIENGLERGFKDLLNCLLITEPKRFIHGSSLMKRGKRGLRSDMLL